ncbi:TetR/AcrR family transcriptional regulator [Micromonospora purpureochromogenes]|uniref:TetR/AcrR family transcriptional regulator n=1 Tax=Micromonospora purpureochromogenes TaxID=47872 RepID=UPI0033FCA89B
MAEQPPAERTPVALSLPIAGRPVERADAARNRRKILTAAAGIVSRAGITALSLDEVARVAGVGVGTVYRRFGDRAGLIFALLDEEERQFQSAFMQGPPPLGPGGPPAERVRAFLHALVDRVEAQRELLVAAETSSPTARFTSGPYTIYHIHLVTLLGLARPGVDAHFVAAALLAPLSATFLTFQRRERGFAVDAIKAGLDDLLGLGL